VLPLVWPTDGTRPPLPTRWLRFLTEVFPCTVAVPLPGDPIVVVDAEEQATLDGIAAASVGVTVGPPAETAVIPVGSQADRLQEIFGYLLTRQTKAQVLFLFTGPPGSGKGTTLRVLEALLGDQYVAPTEHDLIGRFGLWSLMHARVAAITDARLDALSESQRSTFLSLGLSVSGEDKKLIQRKGLPDQHLRLRCRIVLTSNELPAFEDDAGAFMRRVLPTEYPLVVTDVDRDLTEVLMTELPGILAWALDGRDRLEAQRFEFTTTVEGDRVREALRQNTEPLTEFCDLYLTAAPADQWVTFDDITRLYSWWAEQKQNISRVKQYEGRVLGRKLRPPLQKRGIIPHVLNTKENGKPVPRRWCGITWTELGASTVTAVLNGTIDFPG